MDIPSDMRDVIATCPLFEVHGEPPSATCIPTQRSTIFLIPVCMDNAVTTSAPGCKFSVSKNHLIGVVNIVLFCRLAFFHIRRFRLRRRQAKE